MQYSVPKESAVPATLGGYCEGHDGTTQAACPAKAAVAGEITSGWGGWGTYRSLPW